MHTALDRDVWVGDARGKQLPERTQQESHSGCYPLLLLQDVLQLLEDSILQDGVDHQHQSRHYTRKQRLRPLLLNERQRRPHRAWRFSRHPISIHSLLPRRHPRINHPNRIRKQHRRAPRNRARNHRLNRRKPARSASGLDRALLEGRARPFVPVVVDEVGHADTEESGVEAGVETGYAFAGDDAADGIEEVGVGALGFDLGAGREGYERVAVRLSESALDNLTWKFKEIERDLRQSHGQQSTSCPAQSMSNVITLLSCDV
jgi:hypothetical protein